MHVFKWFPWLSAPIFKTQFQIFQGQFKIHCQNEEYYSQVKTPVCNIRTLLISSLNECIKYPWLVSHHSTLLGRPFENTCVLIANQNNGITNKTSQNLQTYHQWAPLCPLMVTKQWPKQTRLLHTFHIYSYLPATPLPRIWNYH